MVEDPRKRESQQQYHICGCVTEIKTVLFIFELTFLQEVSVCNRLGYHIIIVYGTGVLGIIAISKTKVMPHVW